MGKELTVQEIHWGPDGRLGSPVRCDVSRREASRHSRGHLPNLVVVFLCDLDQSEGHSVPLPDTGDRGQGNRLLASSRSLSRRDSGSQRAQAALTYGPFMGSIIEL